MGQCCWYLGVESTLLKYLDDILKLPSHLSTYIIEGKLEILETYPKSEEIVHFYLCFGFMSFTS